MADKTKCQNLRSEYAAIVSYGTSLVNTRFTIAGLYVAAMGFIGSTAFAGDTSWTATAAAAFLASGLAICLFILEKRSRYLAADLGLRGVDIEQSEWELKGRGFFGRQFRESRSSEIGPGGIPGKPDAYEGIFSHTRGFNILYGGSFLF